MEYKMNRDYDLKSLNEWVNERAAEGWRLVSVTSSILPFQECGGAPMCSEAFWTAVMERPRNED